MQGKITFEKKHTWITFEKRHLPEKISQLSAMQFTKLTFRFSRHAFVSSNLGCINILSAKLVTVKDPFFILFLFFFLNAHCHLIYSAPYLSVRDTLKLLTEIAQELGPLKIYIYNSFSIESTADLSCQASSACSAGKHEDVR